MLCCVVLCCVVFAFSSWVFFLFGWLAAITHIVPLVNIDSTHTHRKGKSKYLLLFVQLFADYTSETTKLYQFGNE